jgi:ParB-like chromosome segregation protein Spo0J
MTAASASASASPSPPLAHEFVTLPAAEIRPADYNPRVISNREMGKLRESVRRFGVLEPLVVRRADRHLLAGHQRLRAALAEGLSAVPCVLVDCTDAEARVLNVALNKLGGSWDVPRLAGLLADLSRECGPDGLSLTGFEPDEVDRLLGSLRDADLPGSPADEPAPDPAPADAPREAVCPRCGKRFVAG